LTCELSGAVLVGLPVGVVLPGATCEPAVCWLPLAVVVVPVVEGAAGLTLLVTPLGFTLFVGPLGLMLLVGPLGFTLLGAPGCCWKPAVC
jgi:hypothetical protein